MKRVIIFLSIFLICNSLFSQIDLYRDTSVNVIENNKSFKNAWASGINAAQFNEIDLDLDGTMDLVVFDKSGNKLIP